MSSQKTNNNFSNADKETKHVCSFHNHHLMPHADQFYRLFLCILLSFYETYCRKFFIVEYLREKNMWVKERENKLKLRNVRSIESTSMKILRDSKIISSEERGKKKKNEKIFGRENKKWKLKKEEISINSSSISISSENKVRKSHIISQAYMRILQHDVYTDFVLYCYCKRLKMLRYIDTNDR